MSELGLFPLGIVLLPTEQIPLHIFEDRYREMTADALAGDHLLEGARAQPELFGQRDEILERRRSGDLFRYLIEKFATYSGISGVQPKILIRDADAFAEQEPARHRLSESYRGATHIVKLWDTYEYPHRRDNDALQYGLRS